MLPVYIIMVLRSRSLIQLYMRFALMQIAMRGTPSFHLFYLSLYLQKCLTIAIIMS